MREKKPSGREGGIERESGRPGIQVIDCPTHSRIIFQALNASRSATFAQNTATLFLRHKLLGRYTAKARIAHLAAVIQGAGNLTPLVKWLKTSRAEHI